MTTKPNIPTKIAALLIFISITALLVASCEKDTPSKRPLTPVTVQFGWIPDGHHAGFYVALEKGFYKARGLDITFLPGGLDSNPIKAVLSKSADIGQAGGVEQVISARAQGLPIVAFAVIHRDTPHALISLDRKPIRDAKGLLGKRIAIAYGDAAELLFKAYLGKAQIDPTAITLEPFRFDLMPLINGQVDAVTGFMTDQPVTLKEKGLKPVVLSYASQGVHSYGYTFFTTEEYRANNQELVKAFYAASREGYEYAFAHPDEAIAITKKALKATFNNATELAKLELVSTLMLDTNGKLADWSLDAERVKEVAGYLKDQGQLKDMPKPESIFKNISK
ncbi:ABC transporter substrate-binding protein [Candidatus Methylomirabilis sp.]|uniref:ABC transporter substrate-binding protein n=1 Tax=Candidatus Methylomirabilis sp. TaxID=2032687 RepID=UPI0030764A88